MFHSTFYLWKIYKVHNMKWPRLLRIRISLIYIRYHLETDQSQYQPLTHWRKTYLCGDFWQWRCWQWTQESSSRCLRNSTNTSVVYEYHRICQAINHVCTLLKFITGKQCFKSQWANPHCLLMHTLTLVRPPWGSWRYYFPNLVSKQHIHDNCVVRFYFSSLAGCSRPELELLNRHTRM